MTFLRGFSWHKRYSQHGFVFRMGMILLLLDLSQFIIFAMLALNLTVESFFLRLDSFFFLSYTLHAQTSLLLLFGSNSSLLSLELSTLSRLSHFVFTCLYYCRCLMAKISCLWDTSKSESNGELSCVQSSLL